MRYSLRSLVCAIAAFAVLSAIARFNVGLAVFILVLTVSLLTIIVMHSNRPHPILRIVISIVLVVSMYTASAGPQAAAVRATYAYGPQPDWIDTWLLTGMRPLYEAAQLPVVGPPLIAYCDDWEHLGIQLRRLFVSESARYEIPRI